MKQRKIFCWLIFGMKRDMNHLFCLPFDISNIKKKTPWGVSFVGFLQWVRPLSEKAAQERQEDRISSSPRGVSLNISRFSSTCSSVGWNKP